MLGRLQFREILRQLFLLGGKLCLFGRELFQLLLSGGELLLFGGELLHTAPYDGQILGYCFKLFHQFRSWRGRRHCRSLRDRRCLRRSN